MDKIIPYLIIIILLLVGWLGFNTFKDYKDEMNLQLHNMELRLADRQDEIFSLTKKEFRKYDRDTLLNMLMDSLELKTKNIISTINHKYHYIYDTTVYLVVDTLKPTIKKFGVKFNDCISVYGFVDTNSITFDSIPVNYNATTIYYWERPHKFWFIKYGRKQYFSDTKNNCTGESKVQQITIIK